MSSYPICGHPTEAGDSEGRCRWCAEVEQLREAVSRAEGRVRALDAALTHASRLLTVQARVAHEQGRHVVAGALERCVAQAAAALTPPTPAPPLDVEPDPPRTRTEARAAHGLALRAWYGPAMVHAANLCNAARSLLTAIGEPPPSLRAPAALLLDCIADWVAAARVAPAKAGAEHGVDGHVCCCEAPGVRGSECCPVHNVQPAAPAPGCACTRGPR